MTAVPYSSRTGRHPTATVEVIAPLTGSLVHQVAAELVRRHHLGGNGRCVSCGQPSPCPVRESAARTCLYAGDDPKRCVHPLPCHLLAMSVTKKADDDFVQCCTDDKRPENRHRLVSASRGRRPPT